MKRQEATTHSFRSRGAVKKPTVLLIVLSLLILTSFVSMGALKYVSVAQIRAMVIDEMQAMANIQWVAGQTFTTSHYTYYQGRTYKGMPYTQSRNDKYKDFVAHLDPQEKLRDPWGLDCSTAVVYAWKEAGALPASYTYDKIKNYYTASMVEEATKNSSSDAIKMVGNYATSQKSNTSFAQQMTLANYTTMLSGLQKGDALVYHTSAGAHAIVFVSFVSGGVQYFDLGSGSLTAPNNSMWSVSTMKYTRLKAKGYVPITTTNMASAGTSDESVGDGIRYKTHVQDIGWLGFSFNGGASGTSGQSKRVEGVKIELYDVLGGVEYRTHVQDIGWMGWVRDGALSGTTAQSKRVEAIQIKLTGYAAAAYDVYYSVHVQDVGWMGWAKNGQSAGTSGFGRRVESIKIVLVPKGGAAPGSTAGAFIQG